MKKPQHPSRRKVKVKLGFKTYKERADYLSYINPMREDIYQAIAQFFGPDLIPPPYDK